MADKPLKSITFPDLPDRYTVPQIDANLETAGMVADAKVVGDELAGLNDAVFYNSVVDPDGAELLLYTINTSNKWVYSTSGSSSRGCVIDIPDGASNVRLTFNSYGGVIAFLSTNVMSSGGTPTFATEYTGRISYSNMQITVNHQLYDDTKYLYYLATNSSGADLRPESITFQFDKIEEISDGFRDDIAYTQSVLETEIGAINYGYGTYDAELEITSTTGNTAGCIGVKRKGMLVTLTGGGNNYIEYVKMTNAIVRTVTGSAVEAFEDGITLPSGKTYQVLLKDVSGTTTNDVSVSVYKYGSRTTIGTAERDYQNTYIRTFESDGDPVNIVLYIPKSTVFTNKTYELVLKEVEFSYSIGEIHDDLEALSEDVSYTQRILENEVGAINYGYGTYDAELEITSTTGNTAGCIGVKRKGMLVTLTGGGNNYPVRIKMTNQITRTVDSSVVQGWEDGITLPSGRVYQVILKDVSGTTTNDVSVSVYKYGTSNTIGDSKIDYQNTYIRTFESDGDPVNIVLFVPENTVFTNKTYELMLKESERGVYGSVSEIPAYYFENDYLENRIDTAISTIASGSLSGDTFFWFTDPHFWRRNTNSSNRDNAMNGVSLIQYIKSRTNISRIICGGDLVGYSTMTPEECTALFKEARMYMSPIWDSTYMIIGNHEWNNPSNSSEQTVNELDIPQIYSMLLKDKENQYGSVSEKGDYWFDNSTQKIRYFCIGANWKSQLFTVQKTWFASELLSVPSGYTVVVMSHLGLASDGTIDSYFSDICNIMDAANGKSTITVGGSSYNYANTNMVVACAITGHIHMDMNTTTTGGIPVISTVCDRGPKYDSSEAFTNARTLGTTNEQAIDIVRIDTTNRVISMIRVGGSFDGTAALQNPDRTFSY